MGRGSAYLPGMIATIAATGQYQRQQYHNDPLVHDFYNNDSSQAVEERTMDAAFGDRAGTQ